jgi:prepilin-type N-terminal cleavage/methylation domain-containing protein
LLGQTTMAPRREDGFSLIELMIVVALVAVLAGMTVPAMAGAIKEYELITAGQQVVSTIRSARLQAVSKNMILKVRFDFPADGQYQIVDVADASAGAVQVLGNDVMFDGFTDVQFTTSGRIAAPITVTVANDSDQSRTISVSTSGQVRLQ